VKAGQTKILERRNSVIKNSIKILIVLCLAFGLTVFTHAQARLHGSATGKVIDTEGNPLPGCTVTLGGPALQGQMTFVSTDTGTFRFPSVPPGDDYQLTFEMPGFKTIVRTGLKISVGKATNINITMEMSTLEEEVTVVGESPTVDVKASKSSVNYAKSTSATSRCLGTSTTFSIPCLDRCLKM
jgi:hypothetical protein